MVYLHVDREELSKSVKKITSGHMKICSWQTNGCPATYVNPFGLQYLTKDARVKLLNEFVKRTENLIRLKSSLPLVAPGALQKMV